MRTTPVAFSLVLMCVLGGVHIEAQVSDDNDVFAVAYQAIAQRLPEGSRIIATDDPLTREALPAAEAERHQTNRVFAGTNGLASAPLKELLACGNSRKCSFTREGVAALVSFRLASTTSEGSVVQVSTRYLSNSDAARRTNDGAPLMHFAVYDVYLVRRSGRWTVADVSISRES